ncbi:fumarylacetoacetate hydrolase family protein [Deltaproteobacteria bacterium OttesenSCG-928-K17]|nr:fumarylacetoacetate hydrolase family protein [Deltaproteobacteria bacterium OttesenSCG-928-K17]
MFEQNGRKGLAASSDGCFFGLTEDKSDYPGDLDRLLAAGASLPELEKKLRKAPAIDPAAITYLPPLPRPGKIICLGLNYLEHVEEFDRQQAAWPEIFARFATSLVGHERPIIKPAASDCLDYEGEMVVVIGRAGRDISREKALEHVAAYSIFNDASVRDFQRRGTQWTAGKNFDSTGGFGPWLVAAEALPAGGSGLKLTTRLNGRTMQAASTAQMIFDVAAQIAIVSQIMTLLPGDMLITGTPGGVGQARDPQVFMKAGDLCEVEIEGIGLLRNPVAAA